MSLTSEDLEAIRIVVREEIEASQPPVTGEPANEVDDEEWGNANGYFTPPGFPDGKWWPYHTKQSHYAQSFFETHVNMYMGTDRSLPVDEDGNKIPAPIEEIYPYNASLDVDDYRADVVFASEYRGTPDENFG